MDEYEIRNNSNLRILIAAKLYEPYIRELQGAMVTGNIIKYDTSTEKYYLPRAFCFPNKKIAMSQFITHHCIKYFSSVQYFLIHMTDIYMILSYQSPFHILNSYHNMDTSSFSDIMDQSCFMNPIVFESYYWLVTNIRLFWSFEKPVPYAVDIGVVVILS